MDLRGRLRRQAVRNGYSDAQLARMLRCLDPRDPNVLTVGFARRFATYKRGTLIFRDSDRLARLVNESSRPVVFVFAGKAHPADGPAQDLIRTIHRYASDPRFEGKILLVEGYDLALARHMVTGVDVWLNTPEYPLEASGTSGQKAGMNGVINLSVLDGWWDEGYEGDNGWAIRHFPDDDRDMRNLEEADTLYELLEREVVPLYYAPRGSRGYSAGWVAMAKRSMMTLLPHFSATRMVEDYVHRFYRAAADRDRMLRESEYQPAIELDAWKNRVRSAWPGVGMRRLDHPQRALTFGQTTRLEVAMRLNGLSPDDIVVECLFDGTVAKFEPDGPSGEGEHEHRFVLDFTPDTCGVVRYSIRAYPYHPALAHPHETGYLVWL
jgi:starch phosphorylase